MSTTSARTSEPQPRARHFRPYDGKVWRVVEAQHRISTNRLARSIVDQALLEQLVEDVKPRLPPAARGLHYLLATPFRYGHRRSSRFRRAEDRPGIFYASEDLPTAVAETAWWRLYFLSRSPEAQAPTATIEHTAFNVSIKAARSLDVTRPPFAKFAAAWMAPHDYTACQRFAVAAREIRAEVIRYRSVRDPEHRPNIAVLDPTAFASTAPKIVQTWHFRIEPDRLSVFAAYPGEERFVFRRE